MNFPVYGSCQCKQVRYKITGEAIATAICHCTDCQKLSASAFSLTVILPRANFEILHGELNSWDRLAASGNTARCYFCPNCGNRIYHEDPNNTEMIRLKPGTLEDTSFIKPDFHCWTSEAQPWFEFLDELPRFEKGPILK